MGQCILSVSDCCRSVAKRALPPEHKIVGVKEDVAMYCQEWLIEGPMIPEVAAGAAIPYATVVCTVKSSDGSYCITAHWSSREVFIRNDEWDVANFASYDEFITDWFKDIAA